MMKGFLTKQELATLIGIHRNTLTNWIRPVKDRLISEAAYNPKGKQMTAKQVRIFCEHICFPLEPVFLAMGFPKSFIKQHIPVKEIIL